MPLNILCVDDHVDSVEVVKVSLEIEGYSVTIATTVAEALGLMQQHPFDLYIIDVHLPETDGLELCRMIRATDHNIPIVIYSAGAYKSDIDAACLAGATKYIIKPDGYQKILPAVQELTQLSHSATQI